MPATTPAKRCPRRFAPMRRTFSPEAQDGPHAAALRSTSKSTTPLRPGRRSSTSCSSRHRRLSDNTSRQPHTAYNPHVLQGSRLVHQPGFEICRRGAPVRCRDDGGSNDAAALTVKPRRLGHSFGQGLGINRLPRVKIAIQIQRDHPQAVHGMLRLHAVLPFSQILPGAQNSQQAATLRVGYRSLSSSFQSTSPLGPVLPLAQDQRLLYESK
jgi:hypothetical protein